VALDQEGASVVISHDGDFVAAKFIGNCGPALKDEVMYYIIGAGSEMLKPQILVCGQAARKTELGDITWADLLQINSPALLDNNSIYYGVFGLTLAD
jgi:hypothetical protein